MSGRRSFGPVVLLGLAGAALAAVAGSKPWVDWDAERTVSGDTPLAGYSLSDTAGEVPLAGALALVVLACWGVVLVTRGLVRRVVTVLGLLASLGLLATTLLGYGPAADGIRDAFAGYDEGPDVGRTVWFWAALVGALVCVATSALAVRLVSRWPEMGRRYDAPAAAAVADRPEAAPEEQSSLELWKALDEGRDPTERPGP
ncbi:Trp biosynthesis-associated membrane protein [Nocardioides sp. W7]|uniref:Trp biosynthesis-associated membrane protein n=1 Tax=Nocardioides sp. W7 TaxID=2931390 RepID=UPI001FD6126B|nr:Trp biosynthesis-associated membrane protein [Nocardioides sp. W7]